MKRGKMLLSYEELLRLVETGVITGCPFAHVNSASIDVTLAPKILVERNQDICRAVSYQDRQPLAMDRK